MRADYSHILGLANQHLLNQINWMNNKSLSSAERLELERQTLDQLGRIQSAISGAVDTSHAEINLQSEIDKVEGVLREGLTEQLHNEVGRLLARVLGHTCAS